MDHARHAIEQLLITGGSITTKAGGTTAFVSGVTQYAADNPDLLSLADIGVLVGIVGVLCGVSIQMVANVRRDRRESRLHQEKMRKLREEQ